ncbi:MAG: M20/M25/M40 family metallo-hydrolase [Bryobacteraceae bacterium]|nr:M20/M25/M40 family metallo-hydrolase [Bryobacteraceae bacterium]
MGSPLKIPSRTRPPDFPQLSEILQTPAVKDALQWFSRERVWINDQHVQLCRVPAPTFLEGRRAEWMVNAFRTLGWEARIDRGGNVIASPEPHRGSCVALTAHLDTVLAPRVPEDIRIDPDGTLRGPGVSDNGAGLAALLAIAKLWKSAPPLAGGASLLLVANVGEEGEGNLSGMRYLCHQSALAERIRSFVVLDGPATSHITSQALASRRFEVTLQGPGGHSWSDFGTANPVHALSRAISSFTDDPRVLAAGPRCSWNFAMLEGGSSINSIPADARTKIDIRAESPERIEELVVALTNSVGAAVAVENDRASSGRISPRIREIGARPGGRLADDAPILKFVKAVDAHLGIRSQIDCASTDANIPLSMSLPAISIGAGGRGGGAHTPTEWYHPEGREVGLRRILLTLALLLNEAAA